MITAVSQLAQFGPILLFLVKCKCVSCFKQGFAHKLQKYEISDRFIIYVLFFVGLSSGAILAMYWNETMTLFGEQRSAVFFACVFCLAILDCTCTIVFLTYIGSFKGNYITALYIGEGISSLLPSILSLIQGVGEYEETTTSCQNSTLNLTAKVLREPRFGVTVYFWLLFIILAVSFLAFLALEFWPGFNKEMLNNDHDMRNRQIYRKQRNKNYEFNYKKEGDNFLNDHFPDHQMNINRRVSFKKHSLDECLLLVSITLVSFVIYGVLPGLSSYSGLPYSPDIMHLCSTLCNTNDFFIKKN
jgi:riboflavin transporter 2